MPAAIRVILRPYFARVLDSRTARAPFPQPRPAVPPLGDARRPMSGFWVCRAILLHLTRVPQR
jgi:hypothetical protein